MEIYIQKVTEYYATFDSTVDSIKIFVHECDRACSVTDTPGHILQNLQRTLSDEYAKLKQVYAQFSEYLIRTGTEDSNAENLKLTKAYTAICENVDSYLSKLTNLFDNATSVQHASETKSQASYEGKSRTSSRLSKTNTMVAMKLAKAEAARVKLEFSEREAMLKFKQSELEEQEKIAAAAAERKKSELQIQLKLIEEKKEIAAAQAEADVLESSLSSNGGSVRLRNIPKSDPVVRTAEFVASQSQTQLVLDPTAQDFVPQTTQSNPHVINQSPNGLDSQVHPVNESQQTHVVYPPTAFVSKQDTSSNLVSDFGKFLLKKDLLLSRLSVFTEKPENYMVWKNSFKSIMAELCATAFEELDLLVKWLGSESSNQIMNIRASHANNPNLGLKMAWERLDNKFGSPEMVDESLKKKLHNFPKLSNKDSKKLYDLADLVSEIEALKQDPKYSTILSYYDASSGVIPIVNKLPYNLREKWVTRASNYKQNHNVAFPPFSLFCSFVRDMSKIRNDPSLRYETSNSDFASRSDSHNKEHISSRKTEVVNQKAFTFQQNKCPLHRTNHSLNNCRAFRQKSIDERKKWLKEKGYCFRCCDSVEHKSKDCKAEIKCSSCQSTRHSSALHIDRPIEGLPVSHPSLPLQTNLQSGSPLQSQGGEKPISREQVVSKCTQICGDTFEGKSCAKIVLVKVYHKDNPRHFIKTYAMLDDQSNRTLARTDFFNLLGIESNQVKYTMSSCTGTKVTSGQIACGYVVEALDGSSKMELPSVLECNEIPNIPGEISTPEVARYHSHLKDIADCIPPLETQTQDFDFDRARPSRSASCQFSTYRA